ncbi:MAG: hypothetical protein QOC59_1111 [Microbacteriaceae bacterium]|nr:hypothetical protein [Microbacteriaceae bacterium]
MRSLGRTAGPLAAVIAAALLTGCAEPRGASAPTASSSSSAPALGGALVAPEHDAGMGGGRLARLTLHRTATPAGALVGPAWRLRTVSGASVEIAWYDRPSTACGAATDVWIGESQDRVVIDLSGRGVQPNVLCAAILAQRRAVVHLAQPLGGRRLLEHRPTARSAR